MCTELTKVASLTKRQKVKTAKKQHWQRFDLGHRLHKNKGPLIDNTTMFHVMQRHLASLSTVFVILPTILWTERRTRPANKIHFWRKGVSPLLEQNKAPLSSYQTLRGLEMFLFLRQPKSKEHYMQSVFTLTAAPQGDTRNFYNHLKRHHRATFWQRDSLKPEHVDRLVVLAKKTCKCKTTFTSWLKKKGSCFRSPFVDVQGRGLLLCSSFLYLVCF